MKILLSTCGGLFLALLFCSSGAIAQGTPAKIVSLPQPEYSQTAKDAGVGGEVLVVVLIDKKGKAVVKDSLGPIAPCSNLDDPLTAGLRAAAVQAAKKATFESATWKGKPVEKGITLRYRFDPDESQAVVSAGIAPSEAEVGEIISGRAINIPRAKYPSEAQGTMGGGVQVSVIVFEDGHVHFAGAISGHPVFRRAAVEAACQATYVPTLVSGKPVKSAGVIPFVFYNTYE